jgi:hypothetical protein
MAAIQVHAGRVAIQSRVAALPPPAHNPKEAEMARSTSKTGIRPVEILIHVDDFRSQRIPGLLNAKVGSAFLTAAEVVKHLPLDDWLTVNPRVPNRNAGEVLTGHVVRGIRETLAEAPKDFALKNQGLYLLVEEIGDYERVAGGGRLRLRLSDPESHGLCNGGHTYAAIREYAENGDDSKSLDEAFVRLHIFEGIDPEKVPVMAEGLNRSKQVDDPSLQNLRGLYDSIREAMDDKPGHKEISYHQGESGAYYITEVVRALMFFNCVRFDDRRHPNNLYRNQKKMVAMFEEDYNKSPSPIAIIVPHVHDILALMDKIAQGTQPAAKRLRFEMGRMSDGGKGRVGSEKHKNTKLHFIDSVMDYKVPNGWLMVMLAAFRANVRWDLEEGVFEWQVPLDELLPKVIDDLVRVCVQEYRDNKVKPDEMARNASIYEQCYDKIALTLHKIA